MVFRLFDWCQEQIKQRPWEFDSDDDYHQRQHRHQPEHRHRSAQSYPFYYPPVPSSVQAVLSSAATETTEVDVTETTKTPASGSPESGKNDNNKNKNISALFFFSPDNQFWKTPVGEFLTNMGACLSRSGGAPLIHNPDGDEQDYYNRFIEDRVLGEGEFGVVKLVHDMKESAPPNQTNKGVGNNNSNNPNANSLACKTLRKGVVFKDNILYAPLKPEVLQCEVDILRTLAGQHCCLGLVAVYETPRLIFMVTEFCSGGEMMTYVANQEEDLRTDDVSRIAFQMLDAVNHCAKHNIIHRDIKPENIMFLYPTPGADLRLIDFGSGTNRVVTPTTGEGGGGNSQEGMHTTFAGSAFYISPEMFQRTYSQRTDVWSVGVALYVLVAGYPADVLQRAFNLLHEGGKRNLRELPNMPEDMPDSYYELLEGALVYRHRKRKTAAELLENEFVQFHHTAFTLDQIALQAQATPTATTPDLVGEDDKGTGTLRNNRTGGRLVRTTSISLKGSVGRHSLFLDYQKFERSLTLLLATLLDKKELQILVQALNDKTIAEEKQRQQQQEEKDANSNGGAVTTTMTQGEGAQLPQERLDVIPIKDLKQILEEQKQEQV
jgi:serine/threonine protein kinase